MSRSSRRSRVSVQPCSWSARRPSVAKIPCSTIELRRVELIPKRDRDDRLPIIRVGILISKRVDQEGWRVDLAELPGEYEGIAVRWLHHDPIPASDPHVEVDAGSGKALRTPPARQLVRFGVHPEHQRSRRGQHTFQMHGELARTCCHADPSRKAPRRMTHAGKPSRIPRTRQIDAPRCCQARVCCGCAASAQKGAPAPHRSASDRRPLCPSGVPASSEMCIEVVRSERIGVVGLFQGHDVRLPGLQGGR